MNTHNNIYIYYFCMLPTELIIIRQVAHLSTFRPPVDDATLFALSAGERFLSYLNKKNCVVSVRFFR